MVNSAIKKNKPTLSVIVIAHDMCRELPRTLRALTPAYQVDVDELDYEVLLVENGSTSPLDTDIVDSMGPQFKHHILNDPPSSPAYAINYGLEHSAADIVCVMIDGAHILTPGVFSFALKAFASFKNPFVLVRYFFLGPGDQADTQQSGYSQDQEDLLLDKIKWPKDGYRLFEIGTPLSDGAPRPNWLNPLTESNCFFGSRKTLIDIDGANEQFDMPGGGLLNFDMYYQSISRDDVQAVQLIGEGSFHQIHGGTTTNTTEADREAKVATYKAQYRKIRGRDPELGGQKCFYLGHQPTFDSQINMRKAAQISEEALEKIKAEMKAERRRSRSP